MFRQELDARRDTTGHMIRRLISAHRRGDSVAEAEAFVRLRDAGFPLQWAADIDGGKSNG